MKIAVTTYFDEAMAEIGEITSGVLRDYARQHGYRFICQRGRLDPTRSAMWNKTPAVRKALRESGCDWVLWIDADAVILNRAIRIEDLIARLPEGRWAGFATDGNGLCAGVFLLKNCDWSLRFIDTLDFLGDINSEEAYGDGARAEQNSVKGLMKHFRSISDRIHLFEQNVMNSYEHTRQIGDFILHLSSFSNEQRLAKLREALR
jgi:hypothetical protein